MITRPLILGFAALSLVAAEEIPRAIQVVEPPKDLRIVGGDQVISSTKQFRVKGGAPVDRAAIAMLAEEAKADFFRLTEDVKTSDLMKPDTGEWWKVPITITLHGKSGDPLPLRTVATSIRGYEAGYEIHMDVHLSRGIEHEQFKSATLGSLIYARAVKDKTTKTDGVRYFVPPWLVGGLREATAWRNNQSDRRLYETLFKSGGVFRLDDLFSLDEQGYLEIDGAMRAAFQVSSGALVLALLQQPQGKAAFRNFLNEVAGFQGEMPALLRKHFPELNLSESSLSKWWQLQLAVIGAQNLATDILSVAKTEAALGEALRLNFRDAEGIIQQKDLSVWPELAALPEAERINSVRLAQDALVRLSYRCFPSYRAILAEYQIVISNIAKNKTKDTVATLAALGVRRGTMSSKAVQGRDYLDWFEITRACETSGAFDDYMRLKEQLKLNPRRRDDPLSKYLDRMDAIFNRGLGNASPATPESSEMIPELPPLPK